MYYLPWMNREDITCPGETSSATLPPPTRPDPVCPLVCCPLEVERMRNDCPDCGRELKTIQVLDRGYMDSTHKGLAYTDPAGKKGMLGGTKIAGSIQAMMCRGCRRVLLYAEPKE